MLGHLLNTSLLLVALALLCQARKYAICEDLQAELPAEMDKIFTNYTVRWVDPRQERNTAACLNPDNSTSAPPCASIQYALHESDDPNGQLDVGDLVVRLRPGTYRQNGTLVLSNVQRVAIIGAGVDLSMIHCGTFGKDDMPCSYMNFQIRNSAYIYLSGVTFTRCGPIASNIYVADSSFLFLKDCAFRDNLSPPFLLYNTPTIMLTNVEFTDNRPQYLNPNISHNTCYFSGGRDVFFLDNRTTSGGISFHIERKSLDFLISNCTFRNNSARPDFDVSLPRNSEAYGHGGGANIRLLHSNDSRVCILGSVFEENSAEAHGGGLVIALAGNSEGNRFVVADTRFENNSCKVEKCTAGGVGIDFYSDTAFNQLLFLRTNFTGNEANTSGAISLTTAVSALSDSEGVSDVLILNACMFERNRAFFEGTALGAFSLTHGDQIGVPVEVIDCHFLFNMGLRDSADTTSVTTYRVLISFQGNNTFVNNSGGGISLLGSRMDVNGTVVFNGNTAVFGGGVAMSGRSLLLLYDGAFLQFINNFVTELGAGMYVEYTSSDFVLAVLNRGCFIQYFNASIIDTPPSQWNARVEFINNTAGLAGAALFANDMSRCKWLGPLAQNLTKEPFIFQIQTPYPSPFYLSNNLVLLNNTAGNIASQALATDPASFSATPEFNSNDSTVSYGERVAFRLSSLDQLMNFREAVWFVEAPLETQPLGSLSSNGTFFTYDVPTKEQLEREVVFVNDSANIRAKFTLLQSEAASSTVSVLVGDCHPGYQFDNASQQCVCQDHLNQIVRCDSSNRYFYVRDGFWVGVEEGSNGTYFGTTLPGFLNCERQGTLPGCLYEFDHPNLQCAPGREGALCGECQEDYGVTLDLRFCRTCGAGGPVLFAVVCLVTLIGSLLILYFDFPLPNELKGVIFFAQVIGLIYRSTPYLIKNQKFSSDLYQFFDFLINMLGFAMPFPVCLDERIPAVAVAFFGFIPPVIATLTAVFYGCCARYIRFLSQRKHYGFHGFYFLWLFIYKYFIDTSFIFVSCTFLNGESVFIYQGTMKCYESPFVVLLVLSNILLLLLGVALPAYILYIIYQPKKAIQASNALTHGLKDRRRYRWYSVWDIWRRILFVAVNLFLGVTTRSVVLFIHCLLILLCLVVICVVKPYKKYHINVLEVLVILSLLGATVSLLDDQDIYLGQITSACFASFPFIYGGAFIVYRISRRLAMYIWGKTNPRYNFDEKVKPMAERVQQLHLLQKATTWVMEGRGMEEVQDEGESEKPNGEEDTPIDEREDASELREPLLDDVITTIN